MEKVLQAACVLKTTSLPLTIVSHLSEWNNEFVASENVGLAAYYQRSLSTSGVWSSNTRPIGVELGFLFAHSSLYF